MEPKQRSKTVAVLVVAAAVVVVALIAALVLAVVTGGDESEGGDTAAPATPTEPEQAPEDVPSPSTEATDVDLVGRQVTVVDSSSGTPREQTGDPGAFPAGQEMVGPPAGLELQRVSSGTTLMVSRSDGPSIVEAGVMTGYSRSPGGAALLAANYQGLGLEMGHAYADFLEQFMPGDVAEDPKLLDEVRARGSAADGQALMAAQGYNAPRWFKFGQCDENFCTVEVAMPSVYEAVGEINSPDPNVGIHDHQVFRVSMKWASEQWEIISGRPMTPVTEIDGSWSRWI